jgi:6-phosphogluconolactonase
MTNHQADYRFHEYANDADYVAGVTAAIVTGLKLRTSHEQRAQLLLSGGASPAPVYEALSTQNLDWSLVDIGLVDERWVVNTSQRKSASNAAMVTKTLHTENTAKATIHTLADYASDMPSSIANANKQFQTPTVVVLGMGEDGHTASLFPDAPQLREALDSKDAYTRLDAKGCPVAGQWTQRITLTPAGWANAASRLLLIRGNAKKAVFDAALVSGDMLKYPVLAALNIGRVPLDVHWAA